jgi:hypothetical protein
LGEIAWNHDNFQLATQLSCRIAQISLKHGPNKYSALGFAALGLGLRQDDHMDESIRAGHIALTLSARRLSTLSDAMAESMVYYFIDHWSTPYSTCRAALEDSYRRIQGTGDVSHSVFCGHILISLGRLSGEPLSQLNVMCHELVDEVKRHNAEYLILRVLPGYQFQLNMMGEARDTLVLSGDAMTEETFVAKCAELHVVCPVIVFHVQKMKLAYYFCKYDKANESKKEVYKYLDVKQCGPQAMLPTAIWFGGLIAVEMYNLTSHKKHLQDAKKELLKLQKWKKAGCQNAIHMAFLWKLKLQQPVSCQPHEICSDMPSRQQMRSTMHKTAPWPMNELLFTVLLLVTLRQRANTWWKQHGCTTDGKRRRRYCRSKGSIRICFTTKIQRFHH